MPKVVALGLGGHNRKPSRLKELAGTQRADRINPAEPTLPAVMIPAPPADLSDDERVAWGELAVLVDPMRIATASDLAAFRVMVEDVAVRASLLRSYRDDGSRPVYVEDTKAGAQLRLRPEVPQLTAYSKLVLLHFARWGLDPADRSRVAALADGNEKPNPLAKFGLGAKRGA